MGYSAKRHGAADVAKINLQLKSNTHVKHTFVTDEVRMCAADTICCFILAILLYFFKLFIHNITK